MWHVIVKEWNGLVSIYRAPTRELVEVYTRGLKANNPGAYARAYIEWRKP